MALRHTALHFGKCTLALHAHRHSSRTHQLYFSHPECPPTHTHTSASPTSEVPHTVVNLPWRSLIWLTHWALQAIPLLTPYVAKGREQSPHPPLKLGSTGDKT